MEQWIEQEKSHFRDKVLWTGQDAFWLQDAVEHMVYHGQPDILLDTYGAYWLTASMVQGMIEHISRREWGMWTGLSEEGWEGARNRTLQGLDRAARALRRGYRVRYSCMV